jgi:hypothetical protein
MLLMRLGIVLSVSPAVRKRFSNDANRVYRFSSFRRLDLILDDLATDMWPLIAGLR